MAIRRWKRTVHDCWNHKKDYQEKHMKRPHLFQNRISQQTIQQPQYPWAVESGKVLESLKVDRLRGLSILQIRKRRQMFGLNMLREVKAKSTLAIFFNQFNNLIVFFLLAAAGLSFFFGDVVEGLAIVAVIIINTIIGFVTELKGVRSIEALRKLGSVGSRVRRNGKEKVIPAKALVVGDIVILEGGDIVTADMRIVAGSKLQADESVLTGESLPVDKSVDTVNKDALLAERHNMLFKGTALTRGAGEAAVVATGMQTELGRISSLVEKTEEEETPLEKRLDQMSNRLIWVSLVLAGLVAGTGVMSGRDLILMIETGIALAIASIPEGLPIVATIALARGVWRMARRNALIKKLSAVETLGATSIICTDKTGTLTQNRLTAVEIVFDGGQVSVDEQAGASRMFMFENGSNLLLSQYRPLLAAVEIGVLCNDAEFVVEKGGKAGASVGDPLEVALLSMAASAGVQRGELVREYPEEKEVAFDSDSKMMATYHQAGEGYRVAVKGAPENVLKGCDSVLMDDGNHRELSDDIRRHWQRENERMAAEGLRVLALAEKRVPMLEDPAYNSLSLIGLIGLIDPPREEVRDVLRQCREAGIRVVMVTGDQAVTAQTIGHAVGLVDEKDAMVVHGHDLKKINELSGKEQERLAQASLFARVSPAQKLDLIALHRNRGSIVAMTGDGVNDAPALKNADIGIAMGLRGTQVAREAADMILKDDAFSSIAHAIEQGRIIFKNIRAFVMYLLSCNLSEILTVVCAAFLGLPLPLLPLQILFLNIVTDVFPALALAASEGNPGIMKQRPRDSREPIVKKIHWLAVTGYGVIITAAVLTGLWLSLSLLKLPEKEAVTVSFLTLAFAQLFHVFNMREIGTGMVDNAIVRNRFVWGAVILCFCLTLMTLYLPILSTVLDVAYPGHWGMVLVLFLALLPLAIGQVVLTLLGRKKKTVS